MIDLEKEFNKRFKKHTETKNESGAVFEETPLPFHEFCTSEKHMNFFSLTPRQKAVADFMLGDGGLDMFENQNYLAVLCWGKGCISGDTKIKDALSRKERSVEELHKNKKRPVVQCIDDDLNVHYKKASIPWVKGKDDLYKVITKSGKNIKVTLDHKFKTKNGWKKLKNLKIGDKILDDNENLIECKICRKKFKHITNTHLNKKHNITYDDYKKKYPNAKLYTEKWKKSCGSPGKEHWNYGNKWDKITSIELWKKNKKFYDLEVPKYNNYLANGLYHHNSGKDIVSALLILYGVYVLLCMKNPQHYFEMSTNEPLDLLNVAASSKQASSVYFTKFKNHVLNWQWLKEKYVIKQSGLTLNQLGYDEEDKYKNTVTVTKNGVKFPDLIRAFSGHSEQESQEGKNLLFFVMDETDAFKETRNQGPDKVYKSLVSSARTRFGNKFKGFLISYPRYKSGFILSKYEKLKSKLHVYTDKAPTWEVRTDKYKDSKTFNFEGYEIPITFKDPFEADPGDAKCRFMCIAPDVENQFFEYPDRIEMVSVLQNKLILRNKIEEGKVKKEVDVKNLKLSKTPHIITIDLGARSDSAALSLSHKIKDEGIEKVEFDLNTAWVPNPNKGIEVDFINVWEIIEMISKKVNIEGVYFDQWESKLLIQLLNKRDIPSYEYRLNYQDYKNMKEGIYLNRILLTQNNTLKKELKELKRIKNKKVDHPKKGCFTGDTKIALLDGRNLEISKLKEEFDLGKENWVYSIDLKSNKVVPKKVSNCILTKKVNKLIEIKLDNGKKIKCTKDHKFMLRSGEYKEAKNLKPNESLMPLYKKNLEGYRKCYNPLSDKWFTEYIEFFDGKNVKDKAIHHKDFNKKNNNPTNLEQVSIKKHAKIHNNNTKDYEAISKKIAKYWKNLKKENREDYEKVLNVIEKVINKIGYCNKKEYNKRKKYALKVDTIKSKYGINFSKLVDDYKKYGYEKALDINAPYNHKVKNVKEVELNELKKVYDISVKGTHNFALSSGIFVHNSKDLLDTVCGAYKILIGDDSDYRSVDGSKSNKSVGMGGTIVGYNLDKKG